MYYSRYLKWRVQVKVLYNNCKENITSLSLWLAQQYIIHWPSSAAACVVLLLGISSPGNIVVALEKKSDSIYMYDKLLNKRDCFFFSPKMSRDMWFPIMWHFDMNRLRRAYAAYF